MDFSQHNFRLANNLTKQLCKVSVIGKFPSVQLPMSSNSTDLTRPSLQLARHDSERVNNSSAASFSCSSLISPELLTLPGWEGSYFLAHRVVTVKGLYIFLRGCFRSCSRVAQVLFTKSLPLPHNKLLVITFVRNYRSLTSWSFGRGIIPFQVDMLFVFFFCVYFGWFFVVPPQVHVISAFCLCFSVQIDLCGSTMTFCLRSSCMFLLFLFCFCFGWFFVVPPRMACAILPACGGVIKKLMFLVVFSV